jgi:hypothetical protein
MLNRTRPCLALPLAGNAKVQGQERAAALPAMDRAVVAAASRAPEATVATRWAEARIVSLRFRPDGQLGESEMRLSMNAALLVGGVDGGRGQTERRTGGPTAVIRDPVSVVWGEYEFRIDGEFSPRGIDSVGLVKLRGARKPANRTWTAKAEN